MRVFSSLSFSLLVSIFFGNAYAQVQDYWLPLKRLSGTDLEANGQLSWPENIDDIDTSHQYKAKHWTALDAEEKWHFKIAGHYQQYRFHSSNNQSTASHMGGVSIGSIYQRQDDERYFLDVESHYGVLDNWDIENDAIEMKVNTGYVIGDNNEKWIFALNYSNRRGFLNNIPLPGIVYFKRFSGKLQIAVGIPVVFVQWGSFVNDHLRFSAAPFNAELRFFKSLGGPFGVYTSSTFTSQAWVNGKGLVDDEKFDLHTWSANLGLQLPLSRELSIDLSARYEFERNLRRADSFLGDSESKSRLDPSIGVRLNIKYHL